MNVSNNSVKACNAKIDRTQGEIDELTIIIGDFSRNEQVQQAENQ